MKQDWIAGKNPILEALQGERVIDKIWVSEQGHSASVRQVRQLAQKKKVTVQEVPRAKLDKLAQGVTHQGLVAFVAAYDYVEIKDLFEVARKRREPPFFLLLDQVQDPHNLGAMLRTADAAGVHGVLIPKRRAVGLTQAVAKASAGAIEHVPVARVTNMSRTIDELKSQGIWICGTDAQAEQDYRQADYSMPLGLVIGNEEKGMSRLVKEKCDFQVRLPLRGQVRSLNASVAAALCMFEVLRNRDDAQ